MTRVINHERLLLLVGLFLTGVWCEKESQFVYSTVGDKVLLSCTNLITSDCSRISWTFFFKGDGVRYTKEVNQGKVWENSDKASRMSLSSNCSLVLQDLKSEDAGSYVCLQDGNATTDIYFSVLAISSVSTINNLQPGGNLSLSCVLFTYFDAGSCKSYSNGFILSWAAVDGTELLLDTRYKLTHHNRCHITLTITNLQREDNNRKWRCQMNTTQNLQVMFLDFKSTFLFGNYSSEIPVPDSDCSEPLPISRIVLCVALPVMVIMVGFFTWRADKKRASASTAGIELQELK
ncbi:uncharacterized protein LKV04_010244 [Tautogolabrus adspersus]